VVGVWEFVCDVKVGKDYVIWEDLDRKSLNVGGGRVREVVVGGGERFPAQTPRGTTPLKRRRG